MMDIKTQVEHFKGLAYDVKREKVLDMLKQIQWTHETFAMFYTKISTWEHISEEILVLIYQWILEVGAEIEAGNKDNAQDKIKKMSEILLMIRKQEELDKAREWDPEELLKNI